ncbi:MAG TPA: hypothetical protein VF746_00020 [Longimicrobium sp.]|jgi:hypothetical protein
MRRNFIRLSAILAAGLALAACDDNVDVIVGGDPPDAPRDLLAEYTWVLEGFSGSDAVGQPAVDLTWLPPTRWNDEPFRVYARRAGGQFVLIATVTSCTTAGCAYRDLNVSHGQTYEYYVATVNERTDEETPSDFREQVAVPVFNRPATVQADSSVALDNALYLRWRDTGNGQNLSRYIVYLTRIDGQAFLYHMGETDGTAFVDVRAENGHAYSYRVAAVDTFGHVGSLGPELTGVPRPDASAELVYAFGDNAAQSGFRFQTSEATNPIVAGTSTSAHWRLESDAAGWRIVPLNGTSVVEFPGRTTALACGPGADAGCRAATRAPATGYQTTPITVNPEFSYVFRVTGDDGQLHHGVVRVTLLGSDASGRDLMIFDWAYQLRANEPRLDRTGS